MINKLDVIIWGKKVGTLIASKNGYKQQICFYFDSEYVKTGIDISPLRAPLSGVAAQRGLPVYPEEGKEFGGLPSFIADSLPDHWGNVIFSEWAKTRHIRTKDLTALDKLAYIGRRGMGALEFLPPTSSELESPFKVEISELSRLAQTAMDEAKNFHAEMSPGFVIESLFKVGTSAGGRRPKAVINFNQETNECYSGQVPTPTPGFIPMIIKFDEHTEIPTTRIEYSYFLMALDAGINLMPSKLITNGNEAHFLTERFDRKGCEKLHIQTLAAINPHASSYEELFEAAIHLGISGSEINQLFLQMVMNIVGGNIDDHNKNFSFMMDKDGIWHISPAYDFTFAVEHSAPSYVNRHSMSINGKNHRITKSDILEIAETYNIKSASTIIQKVVHSVNNYRTFAQKAGIPEYWIRTIETEISNRIPN